MMISGGEDLFARDLDQTRQLRERGSLVVIGMAETQVNGVALVMKLRLFFAGAIDEFGDAVQFLFVLGHEPLQAGTVIQQARLCFLVHKIDDFRQD
jgi:hypothetical protein